MLVKSFHQIMPKLAESAYIADNVVLTGDVEIGEDSNVWFGVVMRGDMASIRIGKNTNIQDLTMVHVDTGIGTVVGDNVTVGHMCIIHGCKIGNNVLVGMGSTVMNNVVVGENTIIGAGSLVTEGKQVPSGVLMMGRPAKVVRELTQEEIAGIQKSADGYVAKSKVYIAEK